MGKSKNVSSEYSRCNKTVIFSHALEAVIITVAYVIEIIKGNRSLPYVLLIAGVCLVPVIIELIMYMADTESKLVKYVMLVGASVMYACIMMTANTPFVFVYIIPLIIVASAYNNTLFSIILNIVAFIINVIEVVYMLSIGTFSADDSANIEIQLIVMLMIFAYSVTATRILDKNNQNKVDRINTEQHLIEDNMALTMNVSCQMAEKINSMTDNMNTLSQSLLSTKSAMEEVNAGSTDTAYAVQKQLEQTEAITTRLSQITHETNNIIGSVNQTKEAISKGNDNIDRLNDQIALSVKSGEDVTQKLSALDVHMKKMNSIVDIITEITSQTSLLALNASIEAARAGEAGKGFAVVAGEINNMANQTQNATVDITKRIQQVLFAIEEVVNVTQSMIEEISNQKMLADHTKLSFQTIESHSDNVSERITELAEKVTLLTTANQEIVDTVSTISAISEEVAAHANDTLRESNDNINTAEVIVQLSSELNGLANQLKNQ
ncbi:MAG: methyl-accepting chemotaxis protein [Lachnospira sp.]